MKHENINQRSNVLIKDQMLIVSIYAIYNIVYTGWPVSQQTAKVIQKSVSFHKLRLVK